MGPFILLSQAQFALILILIRNISTNHAILVLNSHLSKRMHGIISLIHQHRSVHQSPSSILNRQVTSANTAVHNRSNPVVSDISRISPTSQVVTSAKCFAVSADVVIPPPHAPPRARACSRVLRVRLARAHVHFHNTLGTRSTRTPCGTRTTHIWHESARVVRRRYIPRHTTRSDILRISSLTHILTAIFILRY